MKKEPKLEVRIGIHAGDVIQSKGEFFGKVVNKAARIASLAKPGEILVSDVACAMVSSRSDFRFAEPVTVALRGLEGRHSITSVRLQ